MPALPKRVVDVLRPLLPALTDEIVEAVGREVPAYRRPLEGAFGEGVRRGVGVALERFVDSAGAPDRPPDARAARTYVQLGRGEYRQGRSLEALLAAYRVGARIAWRRIAAAGDDAGLDPRDLYRVGEALFTYIDALSAESAEGWASAQAAAAGERQRRRAELLRLLAGDPPPDEVRLTGAAAEAEWPLPARVAALAVRHEDEARLAARIGPDVLATSLDGAAVLLVPVPLPATSRLARAVGEHDAALGPTVQLREAGRTIVRARQLLRLVEDGVVSAGGAPVRADDHLPLLVLHADRDLARDLAERELAALDDLPARARTKLLETLRVWLDNQGRVEQTAHELGVHPQTVRYRLNQLRDLFGLRLERPDGRHALALALRVAEARPT
jgi:PucR C-terminal helix-turn-helix domain